MTSRDFGFLSLRNTTAYQSNGLPVTPNQVFVTSTNGSGVFSNNINISTLNVSTLITNTIIPSTTLTIEGNVLISTNQSGYNLNIVNTNTSGTDLSLQHSSTQNIFRMATDTSKFIWFNSGSNPNGGATTLVPSTLQLYAYDIPGDTPAPALIVDINGQVGIGSNSLPQAALDVTGNLIVNGTSVSRVSTTSIGTDPGSAGWVNYYGKYCFVNGNSVGTLTLPTGGDVPSDGTILVIRNISGTTSINIVNSIGGASILADKTISYVYTTSVTPGWYSLFN